MAVPGILIGISLKHGLLSIEEMSLTVTEGARKICEAMGSDPFFIGRNGTIELEVIFFWMTRRLGGGPPYPDQYMETICRNAGIFPPIDAAVDAWCKEYCEALGELNGLAAGWYKPLESVEQNILKKYASGSEFRCPLRSLEPYYVGPELQWTRALAGNGLLLFPALRIPFGSRLRARSFLGFGQGRMRGF